MAIRNRKLADRPGNALDPRTNAESASGSGQGEFFQDRPHSFPGLERPADRIGVIDVGSNSVRMVVFEGDSRSPAVLFNERILCGLGASLARTGALDPEGKQRAAAALRRFAAIAAGLHVGALAAVATAAVRDATDGAAFCAEAEAATGVRVTIASGADEARLAAQGVIFGDPGAHGVVVDLGGASLELSRIENGTPGPGVTTPLGPLRLMAAGQGRRGADIDACLGDLASRFRLDGGRLYLVGGAWRALAKVHMERINYPMRVLHEYVLPAKEALELAEWAAVPPGVFARLSGISLSRAPLLPMAGRLLRDLVRAFHPGDVMVSGFGLREGICLEHMPASVRVLDPLIAACDAQEKLRARAPGFGPELAAWVKTVLPPLDATEGRLIEAAARLADVNWRTHPDYRVSGSWETVTRATITDIGHAGRAFLGVILSTRYKRSRRVLDQSRVPGLLTSTAIDRAVRIGLAFRLGVVLASSARGVLTGCKVVHTPDRLELVLEGQAAELAGEEVEKRLRHLASELGVDGELRVNPA
jgi:exopolyphosphatase/guanosine-5'-triphosphate,3'-diphosphate pyrophosphatase